MSRQGNITGGCYYLDAERPGVRSHAERGNEEISLFSLANYLLRFSHVLDYGINNYPKTPRTRVARPGAWNFGMNILNPVAGGL